MNCDAAVERMLEADPAELRGEAPGDLSTHLRTCGRCRMVAERLLDDQELLRNVLDQVRPRVPINIALAQATAESRRRTRRRWWLAAGPVLAAAGVAGVLLVGNGPQPVGQPVAPFPEPVPVVQPPPGTNVALMQTQNPDIVVVWLY